MSWLNFIRYGSTLIVRRFASSGSTIKTATKEGKDVTKTYTSVNSSNETAKDLVIFRYENPKFFQFLNLFAVTQFGFWAFLSTTSLTLINVPVSKTEEETNNSVKPKTDEDVPLWRKVNLGSDKYRYGLCLGSFLMGYGILFFSWTYILRSVRYLILRKDGINVSFVTYGPFGKNRIMEVPLNCISAAGSRFSDTSQMAVKVKGRRLFYIIDLKQGTFPQPKIFDQTVGLKRKL